MPGELSATAETFVARLDRVPLNSFHWRLVILAGIGWMFDAMDVLMLGFLLTPIRNEFKLDASQIGLVASATFVGMFIGAAASGRLADRYGRRSVFSTTLVVFSAGALLSAIAPSFGTLLAARFPSPRATSPKRAARRRLTPSCVASSARVGERS